MTQPSTLEEFKEALAISAYGESAPSKRERGLCIDCGMPALENCYSAAGREEVRISGLCELCFDKLLGGGGD